jgi:hypothetical protein
MVFNGHWLHGEHKVVSAFQHVLLAIARLLDRLLHFQGRVVGVRAWIAFVQHEQGRMAQRFQESNRLFDR